jgi:hypothetical protein
MAHVATVTIPAASVSADLTDFVVYIDLSDLPTTEFWGTVANGGGDIRCYKSDGTTQLAREVVSCATATDTGVLHVRFAGTLSSSVDTDIQIWTDEGTEPAVTATYGRNNVWADYQIVHHLSTTSSTANATGDTDWDVNSYGAGVSNSTETFSGGGSSLDFNGGSTAEATLGSAQAFATAAAAKTIQAWVRPTSLPSDEMGIFTPGGIDNNSGPKVFFDNLDTVSGQTNTFLLQPNDLSSRNAAGTTGTSSATINTWSMLHFANQDTVEQSSYLDGSRISTAVSVEEWDTDALNTFEIGGASGFVSSNWDGQIAELRVYSGVLSQDWISTEYDNQSSPSTFYTVSAVGGGGATVTPYGSHLISRQFATIAAARLGGVLQ